VIIRKNVPLAKLTTMRVGGPARFFSVAKTIDGLKQAVLFAKGRNLPIFILGSGSNIIVGDKGFGGLVIKIELEGIVFEDYSFGKTLVTSYAGENWDKLVELVVGKNLYGIENLSLIPGTVGAAPIQNIGAYGTEVKETIEWVEVFDTETMKVKKLGRDECSFRYRDSIFKKEEENKFVVTRVALVLGNEGTLRTDYKDVEQYLLEHNISNPTLHDLREIVIAIRESKLPNVAHLGTVGSFFKNPVVPKKHYERLLKKYPDLPGYSVPHSSGIKIPLAWVLDTACGWRGVKRGNVGVYDKQPLVLVHYGSGNAREIRDLSLAMRRDIYEKIEVMPRYEISFVGDF